MVLPEPKSNEKVIMGDLKDFNIDQIPKKKSGKSIITISTYSYGSNGLQWHYFSKLIKKK